ncbi:uncharacterized protein LOC120076190 [Benincasa hispida]|uniref:uncharacterized protein LOC120076190 n=1 Tax=Benincasa hispida TaxID=102211 RepID=UPI0018FF5641|nr:uncharacterized protein LOC120076190 [Benincasa hispida]
MTHFFSSSPSQIFPSFSHFSHFSSPFSLPLPIFPSFYTLPPIFSIFPILFFPSHFSPISPFSVFPPTPYPPSPIFLSFFPHFSSAFSTAPLINYPPPPSPRRQHLRLIRREAQSTSDLYIKHQRKFPDWFKSQVLQRREREDISFFSLAMGSSSEVHSYNGCIVNGVRFHTVERDNCRATQNSGVLVAGEISENTSVDNNFYGVVDEVLDFQYANRRRIFLLKCR